MAKQVIMGLSGGTFVLNVWVEVEDAMEDKASHNNQETPQVDLPLQEKGVLIRKVNGIPISWPWWGSLGRVPELEG